MTVYKSRSPDSKIKKGKNKIVMIAVARHVNVVSERVLDTLYFRR